MTQEQYDFCKYEIAHTQKSIENAKGEIKRLTDRQQMVKSIINTTEANVVALLEESISTYPKKLDDLQSELYSLNRHLYIFRSVLEAIPEEMKEQLEANTPDLNDYPRYIHL